MEASRTAVESEQDFPFGWRFVPRTGPNGESEMVQVALTLEDVLYPQPEDVIPHRKVHDIDCGYLASVFRARLRLPRHVEVTADRLVDWNVPGLRNHSPDIGVFVGLAQPSPDNEATLCLTSAEEHCRLVVEVVSPHTRENDVERKMKDYHLAGVPLYILIDQINDDGPRWLEAYRHTPSGFQAVLLDAKDRLHLPFMNLFLSVKNDRAVCEDANSGMELGDYAEITRQLEIADERLQFVETELESAVVAHREATQGKLAAEQAQLAAEQAQLAAEQAQLAAEQRNHTLDAARLTAQQEKLAAQEKELIADAARVKAQEKELAAEAARHKAEQEKHALQAAFLKAQQEKLAADSDRLRVLKEQADAAELIRQLRAQLQQLQGGTC